MNTEMIELINNAIAEQLISEVPGLHIEETEEGWDWMYRKTEGSAYCNSPLDAFIDFTLLVLKANDKLTGGDIDYSED